jgi:hypothetical protein
VVEQRKAARFEFHVPVQIRTSHLPPEVHTGELRDISRTGLLLHSLIAFEAGALLELTFCLPGEESRENCILSRANVKTLRVWKLPGEAAALYAVAATIERIEFARPPVSSAA